MKHKMKICEELYLSTIAFLDEEALTTNDRYLVEFCKIVIYQSGYKGLNSAEICKEINRLVLFSYVEEDIERVMNNYPNDFICNEGIYSVTSEIEREIEKRKKTFELRKYVDLFCDTRLKDEKVDRNSLCNLVTRYIFEKFRQSIDQISGILDINKEHTLEEFEQYGDDDKVFLNAFLAWDNDEKNKMIYELIVKSYDFCTINCTEENAFNFENFHFYLDANIIMRLLGINNSYRQDAVKHFIEKCQKESIKLHVTNFTKDEIQKSIKHQIRAIEKEIAERKYMPTPDAMKFAKPDTFTIELYGKYYAYAKANKGNIESFKRFLLVQLDKCIEKFDFVESDSFEAIDRERFLGYVTSLKELKDERIVKTDVNNIMFVLDMRNTNEDSYLISADSKLISWCKEIFVGKKSIVELPSTWLSLIMKYTGRTSENDYASFCKFIRLPIFPIDNDLKIKNKVKNRINAMDVAHSIKDRMFEELESNYSSYSGYVSSEVIAERAYENAMTEHDEKIRNEVNTQKETEIIKINQKNENVKQSLINQIKDKDEQISIHKEQAVDVRVAREVDKAVQKRLNIGRWINDYYNRIVLGLIIVTIIVIVITAFVLHIELNLSFAGFLVALVESIISVVIYGILNALKEYFTNKNRLCRKFEKRLKKKYKKILT